MAALNPVVQLSETDNGIAEITMRDVEHHNEFSRELIDGLVHSFDAIGCNNGLRTVILTGYDTYFSAGGTRELLMQMHRGELRFNDVDFFRLALDCPVPVISAMQGHALGGGFIFGLYSDMVVLSRESVYTANFMNFGFTPGMGATLIAPLKLGHALATEMLFTARNYRGEELKQRGVGIPVVPRNEVLGYARRMAAVMADKPRASLLALKQHMTRDVCERLPATVQHELRMHDMTFGEDVVADRIDELFGSA